MIGEIFRTRSVLTHVTKIAIFLAVQVSLCAALATAVAPPRQQSAMNYTEAFLREKLFPVWQDNPKILASLANDSPQRRLLDRFGLEYLQGPGSYYAAAIDKNRLLEQAPGPRLICLGGSGLAYGLDSELLAQRYEYHPINLGLVWVLVPQFMMRQVTENVRSGDAVVICMEAPMMWRDFETLLASTPETMRQIELAAPELAGYMEQPAKASWRDTILDWKVYADERALASSARDLRRIFHNAALQMFPPDPTELDRFNRQFSRHRDDLIAAFVERPAVSERPYPLNFFRRSGFNEYGDLVSHRGLSCPARIAPRLNRINFPRADDEQAFSMIVANIERLNDFGQICRSKGADVYFVYPPMIDIPGSQKFSSRYAALVEAHLQMPVLNDIDDMLYAKSLFFNSHQHLTWRGTCRRMENLAEGLDQYLEPDISLSPAAHVAVRERAVQPAIVARAGDAAPR